MKKIESWVRFICALIITIIVIIIVIPLAAYDYLEEKLKRLMQ